MRIKRLCGISLCLTLLADVSGCAPEILPRSEPKATPRYELTNEVKAAVEKQADDINSLLCDGNYKAIADITSETTHLTAEQVKEKWDGLLHNDPNWGGIDTQRDTYGLGQSIIVVEIRDGKKGKNIITYTFDKDMRFCGIEGRQDMYHIDMDAVRSKVSNVFEKLCAGEFDKVIAMIKNPKKTKLLLQS